MRQLILRSSFLILILILATPQSLFAEKPNIIFILADDSGFSDLGCYGSEIQTPNLDGLAKNGLMFTQFYNTGRCWPTRAALLSGYYPHMVHRDKLPDLNIIGGNRGARQEWARLLPDFLKPLGYRNYHSGKWHIDGKVLAGGFDRSLDMRNQGNFFTAKGNMVDDQPVKINDNENSYYATTANADHAIACLQEHAEKYANQPFFHYIAFIAPHFPLHAKPEDIEKYADKYLGGWDQMRTERYQRQLDRQLHKTTLSKLEPEIGPPYKFPDAFKKLGSGEIDHPANWNDLTAEQKKFQATKMAIHAAMVDRMDQEIGRILKQLKTMEVFDNTLIFFASDNGASAEIMVRNGGHDPLAPPGSAASYLCLGPGFSSACNTPFRRHKTWVHEGGISTPLIAHWPAGISSRGELRNTPSHVIDIVPTILDVLNLKKPEKWNGVPIPKAPGKSLLPAFHADVTVQRDLLWWFHEGNRAIRIGDFKLVAAKDDPWELYDLSDDRAESKNLINQYPDKAARLKDQWEKQLNKISEIAILTAPKKKAGKRIERKKQSAKKSPLPGAEK